jgi:hypothetical protein
MIIQITITASKTSSRKPEETKTLDGQFAPIAAKVDDSHPRKETILSLY